ncbi:PREDICTED: DNA replication ATP-dependent helicase/nuclease DNA2 [Dufourea novaeangliae]|nr:PREDICTED: DNA replication ATP-dependent helicase/nuclease DNA2 [Dufourea novaeangliae]
MTTDMELEESQSKIIKRNDKLDAHNLNRIQKQLEESNVIHDVFSDEKIHIKSPSPNKNVVLVESKENIDLDGYKLNESKQFIRNNSVLHESNFENISVNQITTGSTQSSRMSTNSKQSDEFGKCKEESDFALNTCIADDFNDCFEEEWSLVNQINFDSLQRCKVTSVKRECNSILLSVKQEDSASSGTVICSGFWKDAKVEKDDIVAIQARKDNQSWVVDNTSGFIVVHADLLISGTTIVGALFCSRKAVLAEKFKKIETLPYYRGDATAMVIGSLAHQLLQKAIRTNIHDMSDIIKLMDSILQSKETIRTLYASEIAFDACRKEMLVFVPRIFEFIQHYLKDKKQQDINNRKDNFKGNITYVHDIEENIWLPKLGVKGKVDVTVEVNLNSRRKIMPLEIKTGRPSFSLEHKGQIILYIMMMALTGQDTDTGLLLYLRENNMQEIRSGHPERRDLILLRNTLANYFAPKPIEKTSDLISELNGKTLELPEPINHHSACSKCSYNALCCAYLSRDTKIQLPESHPLTMLGKQILEKLKPAHIDYVMKWVTLLQMEESTQSSDNTLRYLWTLSPEKREAKKMCVCNLKVIGKVIECDSKYQHTFVRANFNETFSNVSISQTEFTENEYVLVSTDTNINLSAGFIVHLKEDSIIVLLDRNITKYGINESFHIDKYSSFGTLFASNLASVGGLIGDDEICERLRDIVIDKKPATFVKGLSRSVVHKSASIVQELNESQQRVILKVMTANDYILIKGMPGTGKTQTLVALIELLHVTGHSVLITAHTNSALDNILLKLLDKGIDFLRLGSSSISPLLKHKSDAYSSVNFNSPESLDAMYSSKNIVGVTCYGAHHALLGRRTFDVCIVDESAQALQPVVLRPLYSARKFVLAGDPDQLPPIVKSKAARKLGADESLFARLDSENNTVILPKQYRMNKSIMRLANKLTYNDKLEVGNTLIENATLDIADSRDLLKCGRWIQKVLSQDIDDSIIILNTGCTNDLKASIEISKKYPKSDQIYSNVWEAAVILKLSQTVVEMGIKPQSIGIIAPYRAHVNLLKGIIHKDIEVNTVDQYQGRDKDIIIYSCAKSLINNSDIKEDLEILGDHKRLTVAITRAKHKLIVIADKYTLSHYSPFKKLFVLVEEKNIINLHDEHDDFSWETVMSLL